MQKLHINDFVPFTTFGRESMGRVMEIGLIRGGYFCDTPFVEVYEAWGTPESHAPMTACGHNFCFMRRRNGSWEDLDNEAVLSKDYWEYLNEYFKEA